MATRFSEGDRLLIQYSDDDEPELWQERLLAGRVSDMRFISCR